MGIAKTINGLLSLSTASWALLNSVKAKELQNQAVSEGIMEINPLPTDFVLSPPHQEELLQLYAGHRSHSSHSSHRSHSSHYSGSGGGYRSPSPPPSYYTPPTTAPNPPAVQYIYPKTTVKTNDPDLKRRILESKEMSAARGLASYQYEVGLMYLSGDEVEKNESTARLYLEMAALQGNTSASEKLEAISKPTSASESSSNLLTAMLSTNQVAISNQIQHTDSIRDALLRKAADGSADAQYELGVDYVSGRSGKKDVARGKALLKMAALQGKAEAVGALTLLKEP